MKIIPGSWSLVLAGKWNRHILTPKWVSDNLFEDENIGVEFPINRPDLAPRYRSPDNIVFAPAVHRVQFFAQEPYDDDMLRRIAVMTRKLVTTLAYTPLSAIGVNYGFEETTSNFQALEIFRLSDSDQFADRVKNIRATEIKRQFEIDDKLLNFTINFQDENIYFDFNFHYDVADTKNAAELINDDLLITNRDISFEILNGVYDLELENEED